MPDRQQLDFAEFVNLLAVPRPICQNHSVFAFSLHKSGSTFLYNMLQEIADRVGLTYLSIEDRRFALGISPKELPAQTTNIFEPRGYLYGGFRYLEGFECELVRKCAKILLVRHPLDILTSLYFSMTKSHVYPGKSGRLLETLEKRRTLASTLSVEQFALRQADWVFSRFMTYQPLLDDANLTIFRYEDVIYDKSALLSQICRHFGWHIPTHEISSVAARQDHIPDVEQPDQHIRQVHPGNSRKYLSADVREKLHIIFEPILKAFGYIACDEPPSKVLRGLTAPSLTPFLPDDD